MITLETGAPGAGKTLYAVDKLLRSLVGAKVSFEDANGDKQEAPRRIFSNINGLLLEHEKIGQGGEWLHDARTKTWSQPDGCDKHGLNNWHEWAKPGDVICYDEIQKPWPLAAAGSAVPPCITALETHRHMGVDFICMTQHPMLIHANLVRLVGRHLHVRRMGNMNLAVVYEWDSCSRTLLYKNAIAKQAYRYDKSVFDLYKSAEVHTKQPRRIPTLVFGVLFAVAAMATLGPVVYGRVSERINPKPPVAVAKPVSAPVTTVTTVTHPIPGAPVPLAPASAAVAAALPVRPVGCIAKPKDNTCTCFDAAGSVLPMPREMCETEVTQIRFIPVQEGRGMGLPADKPAEPAVAASAPLYGAFPKSGEYEPVPSEPMPQKAVFTGSDAPRLRPGINP